MENDIIMTATGMLKEVNKAITTVLIGGQSYKIGSRRMTRADLNTLKNLKLDLESQIASGGTDSLFDNTVIAVFDGR